MFSNDKRAYSRFLLETQSLTDLGRVPIYRRSAISSLTAGTLLTGRDPICFQSQIAFSFLAQKVFFRGIDPLYPYFHLREPQSSSLTLTVHHR